MKIKVPMPKFGALKGLAGKLPGLGGKKSDATSVSDDNISDHLKPTFFERHEAVLPVVGTYIAIFLTVIGIGVYILLNATEIEEARMALVPKTEINEVEFVGNPNQPKGGPASPEGESMADSDGEAANNVSNDVDIPDAYAGTLAPYPDPGLVEEVENFGLLPIIGSDGRVPWQVYAQPSSSLETRPRIAVVVTDLGLSTANTEKAIAMPGPVTLSFSPYAPGLDEWIRKARDAGHEVMLGLPMEPRDFPRSDAGILSLMTTVDAEQNMLNLNRVLSEAIGYIGVASYQGSGFTASRASVQPIMATLAKRGLVYSDTLENATSVAPEEAGKAGAPNAIADLIIDPTFSRSVVLARLSQLELLAKTQGFAVIAVQPFSMLMDRVGSWARELGSKDLVLTPLSGLIAARMRDS